jgi:hypothetical protein
MSRPIDRFDASAGEHVFIINVAQEASDEALTPSDLLPDDVGEAEITELEWAGLPAVRALLTTPEAIAVFDYVQLSDENVFLQLRNQTPLTEDQWDDLRGDIDGLLNSIHAEDVIVVADAFAFTTPDGWIEAIRERVGFGIVTPDNENPAAVVQAVVFPADQMLLTMTQLLPTNPGTVDLTIAEDPLTALELYAELPDLPVEITDELEDVTYFGYDGKFIGYASPEVSRIRLAILDMEDGNYSLVLVNIRSDEDYEVYADDIEALLESIEYTTPDPSLFGP